MTEQAFDAVWSPDDSELFDEAVERAGMHAEAKRLTNPEYTTPHYHHMSCIVEAIAAGIIAGDPWHKNYQLPPNYEEVVNRAAVSLQTSPPKGEHTDFEVLHVSLIDMRDWLNQTLMVDQQFCAWNDAPGSGITDRYSSTPDQRVFIDLDAVINNIIINLRDQTRKSDAFDEKFEREHPETRSA